jgi:hypothetical protein
MFFSSELVLKRVGLLSKLSYPLPIELDGEIGALGFSSAQAQKSWIRSPGLLNVAGLQAPSWADNDDRDGSQPKCFPIALATPGFGAFSTTISHGILSSGDEAASDTTEQSRYRCRTLGGEAKCLSTVVKTTDVLSLQVSVAVVKIATTFGFDRHGDQVVNVVGCDVVSAASTMLFKSMLRAV